LNKIFIYSSPAGEVSLTVIGKNYSIPQFEIPLINQANNNWTVGPYLVSFNQTNLISIQSLLQPIRFHARKKNNFFSLSSKCNMCFSICL
jgi:hypothetical protein